MHIEVIGKRRSIKNKIAKILGVKRKMVIPEANFIQDLGADSLGMIEISMATEEINGNDSIELRVDIKTVGDVFKLCGA